MLTVSSILSRTTQLEAIIGIRFSRSARFLPQHLWGQPHSYIRNGSPTNHISTHASSPPRPKHTKPQSTKPKIRRVQASTRSIQCSYHVIITISTENSLACLHTHATWMQNSPRIRPSVEDMTGSQALCRSRDSQESFFWGRVGGFFCQRPVS